MPTRSGIMARAHERRQTDVPGRREPAPLIDRDHLESLMRHIGRVTTCELLDVGRAELTEQLDRLARHDGKIGAFAHQVCGVAGTLGLPLLARHAARASEACRAGDDTGFPLLALLDAAGPSLAALDAWRAAVREDGAQVTAHPSSAMEPARVEQIGVFPSWTAVEIYRAVRDVLPEPQDP